MGYRVQALPSLHLNTFPLASSQAWTCQSEARIALPSLITALLDKPFSLTQMMASPSVLTTAIFGPTFHSPLIASIDNGKASLGTSYFAADADWDEADIAASSLFPQATNVKAINTEIKYRCFTISTSNSIMLVKKVASCSAPAMPRHVYRPFRRPLLRK